MFTLQTKISMLKALFTKNAPFYIQFYISPGCYLHCRMCNIVEANKDVPLFNTGQLEKIADNLVRIGAGVILLTGGEPFLRPDIEEIVRIFKFKKLDVRLQTAGLYAKRDKIAKCVEYGARDINISLHSLDEGLTDYITGLAGSWQDTIRTISFVSNVFPKKNSLCALGCVLSRYNIDEIDALLDLATEIGWWLSLVPVHITTLDLPMNFRGHDKSFLFTEKDFPKVRALISRLKLKKEEGALLFDSDHYLESIYYFISHGAPNWRHQQICDSPNLYFAILPDGRFAPCCDFRLDEEIFVYDPDFPKIYRAREFRKKVKRIVQKCPGCNFGSFPEMTLSARSLTAFKERATLYLRTKSRGLKSISEEGLFRSISRIKEKYSIYQEHKRFGLE